MDMILVIWREPAVVEMQDVLVAYVSIPTVTIPRGKECIYVSTADNVPGDRFDIDFVATDGHQLGTNHTFFI
jgi:hypothetical protein